MKMVSPAATLSLYPYLMGYGLVIASNGALTMHRSAKRFSTG